MVENEEQDSPQLGFEVFRGSIFFWRFGMDEIESILSEITRFSFLLGIPDEATTVAQQHPDNARALFKKGFFEASAWTRFVSKKYFFPQIRLWQAPSCL